MKSLLGHWLKYACYYDRTLEVTTKVHPSDLLHFHLFVVGFCLCLYQSRKCTVEPKQVYDIYVVLIKKYPTLVVFPLIIQSHLVPVLFPAVPFVLFEHEDVVIARMSAVVVYVFLSLEFRLLLFFNFGVQTRLPTISYSGLSW